MSVHEEDTQKTGEDIQKGSEESQKRRRRRFKPRRGVKKQMFGCVLLFLGVLNTMLTFKANLDPDPFNTFLLVAGAATLAVGIWQARE